MVSYPIYNLELAGWNLQSTWGWDPAQESLYAQLTRNESGIEADVQGPEIWISPPAIPRITHPAVLAEAIANATGAGVATVRALRIYSGDDRSSGASAASRAGRREPIHRS